MIVVSKEPISRNWGRRNRAIIRTTPVLCVCSKRTSAGATVNRSLDVLRPCLPPMNSNQINIRRTKYTILCVLLNTVQWPYCAKNVFLELSLITFLLQSLWKWQSFCQIWCHVIWQKFTVISEEQAAPIRKVTFSARLHSITSWKMVISVVTPRERQISLFFKF